MNIYFGGNHGLEISGPSLRYIHPDALRRNPVMNKICRTLQSSIGNMNGVFIEKKKFGFSLHYRVADKESKASITKIFYRVIAESTDPQAFSILRGKKVLELVPRIQWDKGKAALYVLQSQKKNYLPIYVGDDVTDETAFKALKSEGVTIRIGRSKKTEAEYYLKGQWEMLRFLKHIHNLVQ